jgi:hypothetical protein
VQLEEWVERVGNPAKRTCDEQGVPWSVCWGQARLESGRGTNVLACSFNFWGVKPRHRRDRSSITGHTHTIDKETTEYDSKGKPYRTVQTFAGWDDVESAVRGYCAFVLRSRYAGAVVLADDPLRWLAYVVGMGYATLAPGKYVRRFRKRLVRLADKLPDVPGLLPEEIDEGLARSLAAMDKMPPGKSRRVAAQHELTTELRRLPHQVLDFPEQEIEA